MPAFEVMCFDGAHGDRELCQEPEDFDTLHWLGEESMIESIIFFSVPGKAGGVIEAQAQGVDGEGARSARWRLPA